MSEQAVETSIAEAEAVATLHELNAEYIRAFVESDVEWYREHLSDDFVCTLADGRRIGKAEFLLGTTGGPGAQDVTYDEIDVRPFGDASPSSTGSRTGIGTACPARRATRTSGARARAAGWRSRRTSLGSAPDDRNLASAESQSHRASRGH